MDMATRLTTQPIMTAPNDQSLPLTLFVANEGIMCVEGIEVFEGIVTVRELVDSFEAEPNSDLLDETLKMQRDVDKPRVNNLKRYLTERHDTVFTGLTIFISALTGRQWMLVGHRQMLIASLDKEADRFVCDGQGRLTSFGELMDSHPELADRTLAVKFVVTNTPRIRDRAQLVRQVFSDYHQHLKKPTQSTNRYFDSSTPSKVVIKKLLDTEFKNESGTYIVGKFVSTTGRVKRGQLMNYELFFKMVEIALGQSAKALDAALKQEPALANVFVDQLTPFFRILLSELPLPLLDADTASRDNLIFNKSVFLQGCAWFAKSIFDQALRHQQPPQFEGLYRISDLPISDKHAAEWLEAGVTFIDNDSKGVRKTKMAKDAGKKVGRLLCDVTYTFPCKEI